jgi:hypothetical protein
MKLDELTQLECEAAAHNFREPDKKYHKSELTVPVVIQPQTDDAAAAPTQTTFGELMQYLDNVPRISQMARGTSRPGSNHMRLDFETPQLNMSITSLLPPIESDSLPTYNPKPDGLVSICFDIQPPQPTTI